MMSEIEKLYELAGEKPILICDNGYTTINCHYSPKDCGFICNTKKIYPPFTAEKQLELIKVIAKGQIGGICIEINVKDTVTISARQDWNRYFEFQEWGSDLPEALAKLITNLWQDLTETEKAEIKRILE